MYVVMETCPFCIYGESLFCMVDNFLLKVRGHFRRCSAVHVLHTPTLFVLWGSVRSGVWSRLYSIMCQLFQTHNCNIYCTAERFGIFRGQLGQSRQKLIKTGEKLPHTGISHAKLVVGVVSWHSLKHGYYNHANFFWGLSSHSTKICTLKNWLRGG